MKNTILAFIIGASVAIAAYSIYLLILQNSRINSLETFRVELIQALQPKTPTK